MRFRFDLCIVFFFCQHCPNIDTKFSNFLIVAKFGGVGFPVTLVAFALNDCEIINAFFFFFDFETQGNTLVPLNVPSLVTA